jgi:hypothetical protein
MKNHRRENMKKLLFAVLGLCLAVQAVYAVQPPIVEDATARVKSEFAQNYEFLGATTYRVESSTPTDQAILLFSGAGVLIGVECSSGTAHDYAIAMDSGSASGLTIETKGKAVSPAVVTSANLNDECTGANCGAYWPRVPKRVANGLAFIKHGNAVITSCIVTARPDSTTP